MSVGNRLRGLVGLGAEGREHIVSAALDLLDEAGLEGLTMRALAERMGVRAASLYWQVPPEQMLLKQSPFTVHILPVAHRAHMVIPPQSTSLSPPFRIMSVQLGV